MTDSRTFPLPAPITIQSENGEPITRTTITARRPNGSVFFRHGKHFVVTADGGVEFKPDVTRKYFLALTDFDAAALDELDAATIMTIAIWMASTFTNVSDDDDTAAEPEAA